VTGVTRQLDGAGIPKPAKPEPKRII